MLEPISIASGDPLYVDSSWDYLQKDRSSKRGCANSPSKDFE